MRRFAYLFLNQLLSRVLPFAVNVVLARRLTPAEFGIPAVHFALARRAPPQPRPAIAKHSLAPLQRPCNRNSERSARPRAESRAGPTPSTSPQLNTVVLTAREGFRRACLRGGEGAESARRALSVAWFVVRGPALPFSHDFPVLWPNAHTQHSLPAGTSTHLAPHSPRPQRTEPDPPQPQVPLGAACAALAASAVLWSRHRAVHPRFPPPLSALDDYDAGVALYALASALELASEPWFLSSQRAGRLGLRVAAEAAATLARSAALAAALVRLGLPVAVAFACGQCGYAAALLVAYGVAEGAGRARRREAVGAAVERGAFPSAAAAKAARAAAEKEAAKEEEKAAGAAGVDPATLRLLLGYSSQACLLVFSSSRSHITLLAVRA